MRNFEASAFNPLITWAKTLDALDPELDQDLVAHAAERAKAERQATGDTHRSVFLSHSSKDKPLTRRLATDLVSQGVTVWLDEQEILVGDSITDRIGQGLSDSDLLLVVLTEHSIASPWVKKELGSALMAEAKRQRTVVMPILAGNIELPPLLADKKYADFTKGYDSGLEELLRAIRARR